MKDKQMHSHQVVTIKRAASKTKGDYMDRNKERV